MTVKLYRGDLPADFNPGLSIAIDTETLGLKPGRDKLCLVQISTGDGNAALVQIDRDTFEAPNFPLRTI
jgi:ribonuclease D